MGLYADRRFRGSNSYSCFGLFAFLRSFLTTYHLIALQLLQGMTSSRVEADFVQSDQELRSGCGLQG